MQRLTDLYRQLTGQTPLCVEPLPKAGSNRHYVRFTANDSTSIIGVVNANTEENRCFIYLSRHFAEKGMPVPAVLAETDDASRYLITDLGRTALYDALRRGREAGGDYSETERNHIRATMRLLPHLQVCGAEGLDERQLLAPRRFDSRAAMFDLNYFKYCFLRTKDLACDEVLLENDMLRMADDLVRPAGTGDKPLFLFRDFQARNIMMAPTPHAIDFQGGQIGPPQYDVASFLWQASARYPHALREEMIAEYLGELRQLTSVDEEAFRQGLQLFVLFRVLQVLGAYGLRGYFERKQYFIDSIPPALQNLRRLLLDGACAPYPYLEEVLKRVADMEEDGHPSPEPPAHTRQLRNEAPATGKAAAATVAPLVVRIHSFSYKKGIPDDPSGNGGGYVFDCRSTHNPGRYGPYKKLTGLDAPVISFLENDGEILRFLEHVYALADTHVQRYIERGFTSLTFCFGCTGGQHRSVYSAQHLAEYIYRKYNVEVRLCHREQGISKIFMPEGKKQTDKAT